MQHKSLWVSAVLILITIGVGYFLLQNKEIKIPEEEGVQAEKEEGVINDLLVVEETYAPDNRYATFTIVYPQFKNASGVFNQKIKSTIVSMADNHAKAAEANWQARLDTAIPGEAIQEFPSEAEKFPLRLSWKPVQVNSNYISFTVLISAYAGGAHGYTNIISFNYDAESKGEITLKDLFPEDPNYLQTISSYTNQDLENQFREKLGVATEEDERNFKISITPMLDEGTKAEPANFSVFTFTPEEVTFYFTEYQVAPYAMGSSVVSMPR